MTTNIVIVGTGSIARLAWAWFDRAEDFLPVAFAIEKEFLKDSEMHGLPVVALEDLESHWNPDDAQAFVGVSNGDQNRIRQRMCEDLRRRGYRLATYISPRADVDPKAKIGDNCLIADGVVIHPFVTIGDGVIFTGISGVGHESTIDDYAFIAGGVIVGGMVSIKARTFLGMNSTMRDGITIGEGAIIGMGVDMQEDAPADSIWKVSAKPEQAPFTASAYYERQMQKNYG